MLQHHSARRSAPLLAIATLAAIASLSIPVGRAGAATRPAGSTGHQARACRDYRSSQTAGIRAGADLTAAASQATAAGQAAPAWKTVARALSSQQRLPDAMLSRAQIATFGQDATVVGKACAAAGVPAGAVARSGAPGAPAAAAALNANTATAWTYFTNNTSLTAVQVAGLEGNLLYESGGALNPAVVQGGCALPPGPCGVGIAQWTDPGGRFSNLGKLAGSEGVAWNTLSVQLQFVWQELTSNSAYGLAALKACTTTACATQVVMKDYERPAVQSTNCSASPQPSYCSRLADANQLLSTYGKAAAASAVQIVRNPKGPGYWLVSDQGGVYSYGGAPFYGSAAGQSYFSGQRAVGMVVDAAGTGYWIISAGGGVYSYGSAPFYGSAAGQSYFAGQQAVGMVLDAAGTGYWIISAGGGVYSYGSAPFYGSAAGQSYFAGQQAVGMVLDAAGTGYWIISASGGVYSYGSAPFYGAPDGQSYFAGKAAASMADSADGGGYLVVSADGGVYAYGDATYSGGGV
jgi:hypothetical protein